MKMCIGIYLSLSVANVGEVLVHWRKVGKGVGSALLSVPCWALDERMH